MNIDGPAAAASEASRGKSEGGSFGLLRALAMIAVLVGAAGSFGLMLRVGRRNPSLILLVLFTVWVLSPFVALLWANVVSKWWRVLTPATALSLTLVLTLVSLAIYGRVAFGPHIAQPASAFLMVPLASWAVIVVVIFLSRRLSKRDERG